MAWIQALRNDLETLWTRRSPTLKYVRMFPHFNMGLIKRGNDYVIGPRTHWLNFGLPYIWGSPTMWLRCTRWTHVYIQKQVSWLDYVWYIVKPDRVHAFNPRGTFDIYTWNRFVSAYMPAKFHAARYATAGRLAAQLHRMFHLMTYPLIDPQKVFNHGITVYEDFSYKPVDKEFHQPEVQIYDKGVYLRGRQQIKKLYKFVALYTRHDIYNPIEKHMPYPFRPFFHAQILARIFNLPEFSVTEVNKLPVNLRWTLEASMLHAWDAQCIKHGVIRIVPQGTPIYTEAPCFVDTPEPDPNDFLSPHHRMEPFPP